MTSRPMIAAAGELCGRAILEWIGETADTPVPKYVKLRVLMRYSRICHWTKTEIRPGDDWDTDHVVALVNGGENREKNLAPIRRGKAHKEKTREDCEEADKVNRLRKGHFGLKTPSRSWRRHSPRVKQLREEADQFGKDT